MIVKLYGVVDRVSGVVDGPHKAVNEGQFLRSFSDAVADKSSAIGQHPSDFYVVELGNFDDSNGDIVPLESGAKRIADATDFVAKENLNA